MIPKDGSSSSKTVHKASSGIISIVATAPSLKVKEVSPSIESAASQHRDLEIHLLYGWNEACQKKITEYIWFKVF